MSESPPTPTPPVGASEPSVAEPLATVSTLPRHTVALAAIAATIGSMVGYDTVFVGWGSPLIGAAGGAMIGWLAGVGIMVLTGHRTGMLADDFPRGHTLLAVTSDAIEVYGRSALTGRPGQRLAAYGRHQLTAVGFEKQLATSTLAIRFTDGSTVHRDAARWADLEGFVAALT